ncbi:SRPBCC domain-containing protein [Nocardioides sp. cx-173]|uniref:SRPBCC domain-containing protein n=1 Tax=Nocardioides sp. cx-173 TaxID=2898796 RepID=UPI001E4E995E|nr:SRPBCC domain-containing protein [Nocardioides sp. cx-173]MCD4526414.1 SRPBCC domain-containing protein [Nocardioides sp. cx-173]UGB43583.1 SRPBCC domain-containing protein [Nocardioides sp. cx-173]
MKQVQVLERAGLVLTRKVGRQRLCYLNPVPLLDLARQWTTDFSAGWAHQLIGLRDQTETIERNPTMTDSSASAPDFVQQVVIHAPVQRVWDAITTADAHQWYFGSRLSTTEQGADYTMDDTDGRTHIRGTNLEVDPPRLLVQTFDARWDEGVSADEPSHLTWRLEERGPLTFVIVEHRGVAGTETGRQSVGGWPYLLSNLKTYVETGSPLPVGLAG